MPACKQASRQGRQNKENPALGQKGQLSQILVWPSTVISLRPSNFCRSAARFMHRMSTQHTCMYIECMHHVLNHDGSVTLWSTKRGRPWATKTPISPITYHPQLPRTHPMTSVPLIPASGTNVIKNEPVIVDAGAAGVDFILAL